MALAKRILECIIDRIAVSINSILVVRMINFLVVTGFVIHQEVEDRS